MIALIQRVSEASIAADGLFRGEIGRGLVVLVCAEKGDKPEYADALAEKVSKFRVFSDAQGKMNLSVSDIAGSLLIASQFTLAADTNSGTRPSFTPAADPLTGQELYEQFVRKSELLGFTPVTGVFGADMKIRLVNDGPVTFWLTYPKRKA